MTNKECLDGFSKLLNNLAKFDKKRQDIIAVHGMSEDAKDMQDMRNKHLGNLVLIKNRLHNKPLDYDRVKRLLELKNKMVNLHVNSLNKYSIASSYIFEYNLGYSLLNDLNCKMKKKRDFNSGIKTRMY